MKVASSTSGDSRVMSNKQILLPLIEDEKTHKVEKSTSATFTLNTAPGAGGSEYKYVARIIHGSESVRTLILWKQDLNRVFAGLNATAHATQIPIVQSLAKGTPLSLFNGSIESLSNMRRTTAAETARNASAAAGDNDAAQQAAYDNIIGQDLVNHRDNGDVETSIQFVLTQLMPRGVLAKVKRHLRRDCRKPPEMKVRTYFQNLVRVNSDELPNLPPFGANQEFAADELIDIILFATPKSWQAEMERQGFDPTAINIGVFDVVNFMEQIEASENFNGKTVQTNDKKKGSSSNKKGSSFGDKKNLYCLIHGHGNHTSDNCNKLQTEAKRIKGSYSGLTSSSGDKKFGNKTWVKKAAESAAMSKQELAAFVTKQVKEGVKKSLASIDKKRKSDGDLNALDVDLEEFNYDLEKLSVESDNDEASC